MSQEQPRITTHAKRSSGGAWWKWIAGAAVAALLVGGGYYAWTNYTPAPSDQEIAANTAAQSNGYSPASPEQAAPLAADQSVSAGATDEGSAVAATPTPTQTASNAPVRHRTPHRAPAVPQEVIGVTPASVSTQDSDVIVVPGARRPVWRHTPSAYRLSNLYPARALETGREGEASLHCAVRNSGLLNCQRISETPAHAGFGDAALRVARLYRHAPQRADGTAAAGTPVDLRVVFRIADDSRTF